MKMKLLTLAAGMILVAGIVFAVDYNAAFSDRQVRDPKQLAEGLNANFISLTQTLTSAQYIAATNTAQTMATTAQVTATNLSAAQVAVVRILATNGQAIAAAAVPTASLVTYTNISLLTFAGTGTWTTATNIYKAVAP